MSSTEIAKLEARWRDNPHGLTFAPLAEAYRKQREPERALQVLADGLARHPDYIPASIVLGRCHLDLADDARAEAAFARVLELDDENVIALKALADIAERQGRPADAADRLRRLLAVDRSNDEARSQLGRVESAAREMPVRAAEPLVAMEPVEPVEPMEPSEPAGAAEPVALAESGTAAEAEEEQLSPADFMWDQPEPVAADVAPVPDLVIDDNLRPAGAVEQLDDILLEEPPAISDASAAAEAMPGLVGEDFPEHRAGVVPLADLRPGTVSLGEQHVSEPDLVTPLSDESFAEPETPFAASMDSRPADELTEPIGELERSAEIELTPTGRSEYQIESMSDEWAARLADRSEPEQDEAAYGEFERFDDETPFREPVRDDVGEELVAAAEPEESPEVVESTASAPEVPDSAPDDGADSGEAAMPAYRSFASESSADEADAADDDERAAPPLPDDLVVTESMAELFLRQGHRAEALLVYRELYHRNRGDLRLREKVDSLETALAAEEATSPRGRSYSAPERGRSVATFLSGIFAARPADAPSSWIAAPAPAASAPAATEAPMESADAAPTRPASDHLSLSDVFGETGSPVPPAVAATAGAPADDGVSFDAFFGEAAGAPSRPRGAARDDEDLDQFHAWLQNLKR